MAEIIIAGEHYWIAEERELVDVCAHGHTLRASQTVAGVWFILDDGCGTADLAGPDILDAMERAWAARQAKAQLALPAGEVADG